MVASCGGAGGAAAERLRRLDRTTASGQMFITQDSGGVGTQHRASRSRARTRASTAARTATPAAARSDCGTCTGDRQVRIRRLQRVRQPATSRPTAARSARPKTCADSGLRLRPSGRRLRQRDRLRPTARAPAPSSAAAAAPASAAATSRRRPTAAPRAPRDLRDLGYTCGRRATAAAATIGPCGTVRAPARSTAAAAARTSAAATTATRRTAARRVTCTPKTCADLGSTCGVTGDGCGGTTGPCGTCTEPAVLRRRRLEPVRRQQRPGADGGIACTPKTCASYPADACGQQSDGCGGLTANCGTCTSPQFCGGGGSGKCGGNNVTAPDGGVVSHVHAGDVREPRLQLRPGRRRLRRHHRSVRHAAPAPLACGGGGKPNVCGSNIPCTGLCAQQVDLRRRARRRR